MWVVQHSLMNASAQRDASLRRKTHQTRETRFYLDWLHWNTSGSTATAADLREGSLDDKLWFEHVCAHVWFMGTYTLSLFMHEAAVLLDSGEFCSDQRLSVHVAQQPTFIYAEAVTSRITPLFWRHLWFLLLSFFENSKIFPLRFLQLSQ